MDSKTRTILIFLLCSVVAAVVPASAQRVSLKTNALYWVTATPNLGAEIALSRRLTFEVCGGYNNSGSRPGAGTTTSIGKSTRHWLVQPELRLWFGRRFVGTFIGLHAHAAEFNLAGISPFATLKNNRHDGKLLGAGIGIGHHWLLSPRWGLELEAGLGFAQMEYDRYDCADCATSVSTRFKNNYLGPTRLNFSLVYYLR